MFNSKKKFEISLTAAAVIILIVVIGVFLLPKRTVLPIIKQEIQPTRAQSTTEIVNDSKETTGLKKFVSKRYRYSFSYQANWQLLDEPNVNGVEIQNINSQGDGFSISIRLIDNPQKLSVFNFAKSQLYNQQDVPEKVRIGEVDTYRLHYFPDGLLLNTYWPYDEKSVLNIFAGGDFVKSKENLNYYATVIDTFLNSFRY